MKCLECGSEMETGTVEGVGQGLDAWYEFTSEEEKKKKGIKGFLTRQTVNVEASCAEQPAWHCPQCKKILMWMDSKE